MNLGDLIVKCLDNGGVGDCPYKPVCIARLTDRTITGCNLPLVREGLLDKSQAVIEHTIQKEEEKETMPKRRKKSERLELFRHTDGDSHNHKHDRINHVAIWKEVK